MVPRLAGFFAAILTAAASFAQPALLCPQPSSSAARACDLVHFHVQMYRPDTRGFADFSGLNQFASQSACERYRDAQMKRNAAVVEYIRKLRGEQQYELDRFGPCHCDMTVDRTNAAYLNDQQRVAQIRLAEDIRLRVREKLLDSGLTSDMELVRSLNAPPPSLPLLGAPKLVPVAPVVAQTGGENSPDDLKSTKAIDTSKPAIATVDLPLVDVTAPAAPPPAESAAPAETAATPAPAPAAETAAAPPKPDDASAADAAEGFISYETQRIQGVLKASSAISDEALKSKIFEACMQRIQLLSNLRSLIEGSGSHSRLASAAHAAQSENDRIALVTKLFGDTIAPEWAPKDAADVVLQPNADVDADPDRVLRDASGRWSEQQKKRALYILLARSQPTDQQQLWLVTVVDSFLQ